MTRYLIIGEQLYSENTPEYGHCDFAEKLSYIIGICEGDTLRKAQNAARRAFPRVRFRGLFGNYLVEVDDPRAHYYVKIPDERLTDRARMLHHEALGVLGRELLAEEEKDAADHPRID